VETVQQVAEIWQTFAPQRPFSYTLLEDNYETLHLDEQRFEVLFSCLTGVGILIVCLGLFALIAFVTEQRTKEIGIRKILGASASGLIVMLNKDFFKLLAISFAMAAPVAFYFMNRWLEGFVYRITLQWWMFVLAGVIAGAVIFITTGYQSIRASLANPIKSLRTE
jgi:putative ABC transport system permease protein